MEEESLEYVSTEFFDIAFGCYSYISVVALTAWDNVVGTVFLKLWRNSRGRTEQDEVTPQAIKVVSDHALKTEMSRDFSGVESKFYSLKNYNVIAVAFLFVVPRANRPKQQGGDLFSLTLALPYQEEDEWLSRHRLLVDKMKAILEFNLIPVICKLVKKPKFKMSTSCLETAIGKFVNWGDSLELDLDSLFTDLPYMKQLHTLLMKPRDLTGFVQLANSIKYHCMPDPDSFVIKESYLGSTNSTEMVHFLERAISAFLYHSGYAIVVGRRLGTIQKMMKTLSYFMLRNERRMSRMATSDTLKLGFQSGLYVQGFLHESDSKFLPSSIMDLTSTTYRPAIIDVTRLEVKKVSISPPMEQDTASMSTSLGLQKGVSITQTDFMPTRNKFPVLFECAPLIHTLLSILVILPSHGGLRESYVSHYMRFLHGKGLVLAHYVNETWTPEAERLDPAVVMRDLSITSGSDLRLLLGLASKRDPSISTKVLPLDYRIPLGFVPHCPSQLELNTAGLGDANVGLN